MIRTIIFLCFWLLMLLSACNQKETISSDRPEPGLIFDTNHIEVPSNLNKLRGQVLYMPIYSSVPYLSEGKIFQLSAFLSVHNTDFKKKIRITKVFYFDTKGKLVKNYLDTALYLNPLETKDFFVPEGDPAGTGANFIIEWRSEEPVSAPLVESVMIGTTGGQGISFLSQGKVLGELP